MICEGFNCTPDVALQQDMQLCMSILHMRRYATLCDLEARNPKAIDSDGRKFMVTLEREADGELAGG